MAHSLSIWKKKSDSQKHRKAAKELKLLLEQKTNSYRYIETLLSLSPANSFEELSDRYHYHLKKAGLCLKEHNLLPHVRTGDTPSSTPFGLIATYLDNIRSAHNIGSIIRTIEAFRLGPLLLSAQTASPTNKKVLDTAMGATVPYKENITINELKGPLVAIETVEGATSLDTFIFPPACTLLLGNEEYGLSKEALKRADYIVEIPLVGEKNSLNVANAFAILAYLLAAQKKTTIHSHRN